jgi:hypothetical protein
MRIGVVVMGFLGRVRDFIRALKSSEAASGSLDLLLFGT